MGKLSARSMHIRDLAMAVLRDGEWHTTSEIEYECFGDVTRYRSNVTTELRKMRQKGLLESTGGSGYVEGRYRLLDGAGDVEYDSAWLREALRGLGGA